MLVRLYGRRTGHGVADGTPGRGSPAYRAQLLQQRKALGGQYPYAEYYRNLAQRAMRLWQLAPGRRYRLRCAIHPDAAVLGDVAAVIATAFAVDHEAKQPGWTAPEATLRALEGVPMSTPQGVGRYALWAPAAYWGGWLYVFASATAYAKAWAAFLGVELDPKGATVRDLQALEPGAWGGCLDGQPWGVGDTPAAGVAPAAIARQNGNANHKTRATQ